jgi:hypothetical protein
MSDKFNEPKSKYNMIELYSDTILSKTYTVSSKQENMLIPERTNIRRGLCAFWYTPTSL